MLVGGEMPDGDKNETGIAHIQALYGNKFGDALAEVNWLYTAEELSRTEKEDVEFEVGGAVC